jgi:hypothetical protein
MYAMPVPMKKRPSLCPNAQNSTNSLKDSTYLGNHINTLLSGGTGMVEIHHATSKGAKNSQIPAVVDFVESYT